MGSAVKESIPFFVEAMDYEQRKELGHSLVETLPICTYDGVPCDSEEYVHVDITSPIYDRLF